MIMIAICGHDITPYPWDYPGVWTQGYYDELGEGWSYSVLCMACILWAVENGCTVQFTSPEKLAEVYGCACGGNCTCQTLL